MSRIDGVLTPAFTWADWLSDEFAATDDDGAAVSFAGLLVEIELRDRFDRRLLAGSSADGVVTIAGNLITWVFPKASMAGVPPGNHLVAIRVSDPASGEVEALFQFSIEIRGGAFA